MSLVDQVMKVARASARTRSGAGIVRRLRDWRTAERLMRNFLTLPRSERSREHAKHYCVIGLWFSSR